MRNSVLKLAGVAASATIISLISVVPASAHVRPTTAPLRADRLVCFAGPTDNTVYGGVCAVHANSSTGPATLDNTDNNPNGDYAGIYNLGSTLTGLKLGKVTQLGYTYSGTTTPTPGDLSLNLSLDTDGNGTSDTTAFIDAAYCGGTNGIVDVIHDANCGIFVNNVEWANWSAFVAANPTWVIGPDGSQPFIIAERTPGEDPALWNINNVDLGPALATPKVYFGGPLHIKHGSTVTLTVYLATSGGTPISGRVLKISLGTGGRLQSCQTGKTNSQGAAHCLIGDVRAKVGTRTIRMTFAGDGPAKPFVYAPATNTHSVTVN